MTRQYATGATRDSNENKLDYEGFISPVVWHRFAEYMHKCRLRNIPAGDTIRASDNWQKGMPLDDYMKSGLRHMMELWLMHRGYEARDEKGNVMDLEEVLCAILFNVQGYLLETLKAKNGATTRPTSGQTGSLPGLPCCTGIDTKIEKMHDMPQEISGFARETTTDKSRSPESNWDGQERRGLAGSGERPSPGDRGDTEWRSEGISLTSLSY